MSSFSGTNFHEFTRNAPTTYSSSMRFVTIRVISVAAFLFPLLIPVGQIQAQTQAGMSAQAGAEFQQADAELNKIYEALLAKFRPLRARKS
jgi:hypothetical protein